MEVLVKSLYYTCSLMGTFSSGALCARTKQTTELLD